MSLSPRHKVMCNDCRKIFTTRTYGRRKCYECQPENKEERTEHNDKIFCNDGLKTQLNKIANKIKIKG